MLLHLVPNIPKDSILNIIIIYIDFSGNPGDDD